MILRPLFETTDYKRFIRDSIEALPKRGRGEITRMAEHLKVNPTMVSQILGGPKHFTIEQAFDLTTFLGLSDVESGCFVLLVQWERAGTVRLKNHYMGLIAKARKKSKSLARQMPKDREFDETEKAVFYSSAAYSGIRLASSIHELATRDAMAAHFGLSRARVAEILKFLVRTGLCTEKDGRFSMGPSRTHLEASSPFIFRHHANWRIEAMKRIERVRGEELIFTAPMCLSHADFAAIRERLVAVFKEISATVAGSSSETLACLNVDFFHF